MRPADSGETGGVIGVSLPMARCVREQQSLAESFGLVFDETLDRIPLDEDEQSHLYRELLTWARESAELFPAIHHSYSQQETREIGSAPARF